MMPNLDPQLAAEFNALEKLRQAVLQYRDEVSDLRKSRGLSALADIPRIEVALTEELQALVLGAKTAASIAPPVVVAPVPPVPPALVKPPVVVAPVPPVVPVPVVPPVVVAPPAPVALTALANQEAGPATKPAEERKETFVPSASPNQSLVPPPAKNQPLAAHPEPGLPTQPEMIAPRPAETTELKVSATTPSSTPRVDVKSNETRPTNATLSPSIPNRRPGMSPSMQTETVGSFLRRFRLMNEQ
jgi:hypothetical protein